LLRWTAEKKNQLCAAPCVKPSSNDFRSPASTRGNYMQTVVIRVGRKRKSGKRRPDGHLVERPREQDHYWHCYWETLLHEAIGLYVVEAGPAIKIGVSTAPPRRTRDIQVSQHNPARLMETFWMGRADGFKAEKALHDALRRAGFHAHGEWFYLAPDTAIEFVKKELSSLGLKHWQESKFRRAA
jgi:hypothetical protein